MKYLLIIIFLIPNFSAMAATWKRQYKSQLMTIDPEVTSCPDGYIGIPVLPPYTYRYFCVMKYEAKNDTYGTPVSTADKFPWTGLNLESVRSKCQSLGAGYDLISNDQWQTIARNIAGVKENWSNNIVGSDELNRGHSDDNPASAIAAADDSDPCFGLTGIAGTCNASTWHPQRRTHILSNGSKIWDFSGNVIEWLSNTITDPDNYTYEGIAAPDPVSKLSGPIAQNLFGALGTTLCAGPTITPFCGMGFAALAFDYDPAPAPGDPYIYSFIRGGDYGDSIDSGIFAVNMTRPDDTDARRGFRCVYVP